MTAKTSDVAIDQSETQLLFDEFGIRPVLKSKTITDIFGREAMHELCHTITGGKYATIPAIREKPT